MRLGGIDAAAWARFRDGRPWSKPEQETVQKIMFRLAGLPVEDLQRLASRPLDWDRLVADPAACRGEMFWLRGRVRSVEVLPLSEEMGRRFELKQYYRVEMEVDGVGRPSEPGRQSEGSESQWEQTTPGVPHPNPLPEGEGKTSTGAGRMVVVLARTVPKAWLAGGPVDQPGGAWALFVKLEGGGAAGPRPVLAASRVAWHPQDYLLGRLGMDVGLLDDLADRRPIRPEERECFYQALAAASRAPEGQLGREAADRLARRGLNRYSVVPLFNDPAHQRGKLVMLSGTARRALRVRVEDPDIRRRFGIDHYYEIGLYTDDSQGNPLVFCVSHLPPGMPTGDGPRYGEHVTVAGFFLKSWAYPSGRTYDKAEGNRPAPLQLAPLLVGREATWPREGRPRGGAAWTAVGGAVLLLVLLGVWFLSFRVWRS